MASVKTLHFLSIAQACEEVVKIFFKTAYKKMESKNAFHVAISGGSSIKPIIELLSKYHQFENWNKVNFFWVDERWVPIDHPDSNFGNALQYGLNKLNCHCTPFDTSFENPATACLDYEMKMKDMVGEEIILDFLILGTGEDGHIASIFQADIEASMKTEFMNTQHPVSGQKRVTMSMKLLLRAKHVILLVFGENKRNVFRQLNIGGKSNTPVGYFSQLKSDLIVITDLK